MKSSEFATTPFPQSKIKDILYHGSNAKFKVFNRPPQGIYVTPVLSWAEMYYGDNVIPLFANVTKVKKLDYRNPEDDAIIDLFYDRDYKGVAAVLQQLQREGYNCCWFGGESDSMVLFGNIKIVNASTGEEM